MGLRTASFRVGHRFDQDTPIAETVRGYTSDGINQLICLNLRCKRFMMSFKLASYVTSLCLPAGHGDVRVSLCRDRRILNDLFLSCTVHAMQRVSLRRCSYTF